MLFGKYKYSRRTALTSICFICIAAGLALTTGEFIMMRRMQATNVRMDYHKVAPLVPVPPPRVPRIQRLSQTLFPQKNAGNAPPWMLDNQKQLHALFRCLEDGKCTKNQAKVVILGSYHFRGARMAWNGGEDIWARSMIKALTKLGYTFLYSLNMDRTIQLYQTFPHLVKAVIVEDSEAFSCFANTADCIMSERNPGGIPAWKMFSFAFWAPPSNPLGPSWTLNPEDYTIGRPDWAKNTYIGYSIEDVCRSREFVPHEDRELQAYVMAKKLSLFGESNNPAWPADFYESATQATGVQFIVGATDDSDTAGEPVPELPSGLINYGLMPQSEFLNHVSESRVLIGVGNPATSPTPYDALCLGVPFINPILEWDSNNPLDRTGWNAQHSILALMDPPHVYNVFKGDREGFINAIESALTTPIDSFILDRMRDSAIIKRVDKMMSHDWKTEAAELLSKRMKGVEEGELFEV